MAYSGIGSGTLFDPYLIYTASQWRETFVDYRNLQTSAPYFKLMNDLDIRNEIAPYINLSYVYNAKFLGLLWKLWI